MLHLVRVRRGQGLRLSAAKNALVAMLGASAALGSTAFAQCTPELDAQSGTAGARLGVTCTGTEADQQGDGNNRFVDVTVSGAIDTTASTGASAAILLGSENTVTVRNLATVVGFNGVHLTGSSSNVQSNVVTIEQGGRVRATTGFGVLAYSNFDTVGNRFTIDGNLDLLSVSAFGAVRQNTVTVGATGRVGDPLPGRIAAIMLNGNGGVRDNVVDVFGQVLANDPGANNPIGVDLLNEGSGDLSGNRVTIAVGGSVTSEGDAVRVRSQDFNNEGSITPAGELFSNAVEVRGSVTSSAGDGVEISNGGATLATALVRQNTVTSTGQITATAAGQAGVRVAGRGVQGNIVDIAGGTVQAQGPGLYFENTGAADFAGNTVTIRSGAAVNSTGAQAVYFFSQPISAGSASADVRANSINIAGAASSSSNRAVLFLSNASVRDNSMSVSGVVRSTADHAVQFLANGAVSGNTVTVAQGGRIEAPAANRIGVQFASVGGGGASNNVVDNSGVIQGTTAVSFGPGSGNRLINRATGALNGDVIFTSTASELVLFAGSTLNGNVGGAGLATATLQGPGAGAVDLNRFTSMGALNVASGRWTATGSGAGFASASIASGAELVLNGSLLRPLTVASGGVLSGVGTTGALTVGGTLAPGNSIGVTNVVGPLTFAPASTYAVEVGACPGACADRVIATGPVTINGGTVALFALGTPGAVSARLPIVTGSSVTGTFSALSAPAGLFSNVGLEYGPTDVFLNYTLGGAFTGVTHATAPLLGVYGLSLLTRSTFDRLSEDENGARNPASNGCALFVFSDGSPSQRVEGAPAEKEGSVTKAWARGFGAAGSIDPSASVAGVNYHLGGFAVGVEKSGGGLSLGAGVGVMTTDMDQAGHDVDFETAQFIVYGGYEDGPFDIGLALAAGRHSVDSARIVNTGSTSGVGRAAYSGWTYGAALETGYGFDLGKVQLRPYAGVDYTRTEFDGFREVGSPLGDLLVAARSEDALRVSAGFRASSSKLLFGVFRPAMRAAYARELIEGGDYNAAFASAPGSGLSLKGAEIGRDRLLVGGGVAMRAGKRGALGVSYDGEFSKSDAAHALSARFTYAF